MDNLDQLVQLLTDRLLDKLEQVPAKPAIYLVGKEETRQLLMTEGYHLTSSLEKADMVVLDQLSLDSFLRLSSLTPIKDVEVDLLNALLLGKKVFCSLACCDFESYQQSSEEALYRELLQRQVRLKDYGLTFYKEGQLLSCLGQGLAERELVTPLSQKSHQKETSSKPLLITEAKIRAMGLAKGDIFEVKPGMIVTALARDYLKRQKINVIM